MAALLLARPRAPKAPNSGGDSDAEVLSMLSGFAKEPPKTRRASGTASAATSKDPAADNAKKARPP